MFICYKLGPNIMKQINMFTHYNNNCSRLTSCYVLMYNCDICFTISQTNGTDPYGGPLGYDTM